MRSLFAPVSPRPMTVEDWAVIHQRGRRLRHRARLRLGTMRSASWIALGLLVALWTAAILL
jgi:hypothetical protein